MPRLRPPISSTSPPSPASPASLIPPIALSAPPAPAHPAHPTHPTHPITPSVRRRARPRLFHRRRSPPLPTTPRDSPAPTSPRTTTPSASASASLLHRVRRPRRPPAREHPKPIYIYPGLLRIVRDKAIALDNQCPAVLYKCRDCRHERRVSRPSPAHSSSHEHLMYPHNQQQENHSLQDHHQSQDQLQQQQLNGHQYYNLQDQEHPQQQNPKEYEQGSPCPHRTACPICLDDFHAKDLVRKLPCNAAHVFHSKCILDWFAAHHRCPLCNEPVTSSLSPLQRLAHPLPDSASAPSLSSSPSHDTPERDHTRAQSTQHQRLDPSEGRLKRTSTEKARKKQRGPRTYSYIVHDNVRMEMNPFIPV